MLVGVLSTEESENDVRNKYDFLCLWTVTKHTTITYLVIQITMNIKTIKLLHSTVIFIFIHSCMRWRWSSQNRKDIIIWRQEKGTTQKYRRIYEVFIFVWIKQKSVRSICQRCISVLFCFLHYFEERFGDVDMWMWSVCFRIQCRFIHSSHLYLKTFAWQFIAIILSIAAFFSSRFVLRWLSNENKMKKMIRLIVWLVWIHRHGWMEKAQWFSIESYYK